MNLCAFPGCFDCVASRGSCLLHAVTLKAWDKRSSVPEESRRFLLDLLLRAVGVSDTSRVTLLQGGATTRDFARKMCTLQGARFLDDMLLREFDYGRLSRSHPFVMWIPIPDTEAASNREVMRVMDTLRVPRDPSTWCPVMSAQISIPLTTTAW